MPASVADAKQMLFTSDYPSDKVVYLNEFSIVVPVTASDSHVIAHGLSFTPVVAMVWSPNSDFSVSYTTADTAYNESVSGGLPTGMFFEALSDGTNIEILLFNNTGGPQTVYFRLFAFMPSNVNVDTPFTANAADDFIFNTDYNYTKLYLNGRADTTTTTTINHGLGYIPQVALWNENAGTFSIQFIATYDPSNGTVGAQITDQDLNILPFATPDFSHYRIYIDD